MDCIAKITLFRLTINQNYAKRNRDFLLHKSFLSINLRNTTPQSHPLLKPFRKNE
jgi:hypothetical protein